MPRNVWVEMTRTAGGRNPWDQRIYFQDGFFIHTSGAQPGVAEGEAHLALSTGKPIWWCQGSWRAAYRAAQSSEANLPANKEESAWPFMT